MTTKEKIIDYYKYTPEQAAVLEQYSEEELSIIWETVSEATTGAANYDGYFLQCREALQAVRPGSPRYYALEYIAGAYKLPFDILIKAGAGFDGLADPIRNPGGEKEPGTLAGPRVILPTSGGHYVAIKADGKPGLEILNPSGVSMGIFNADAIRDGAAVHVVKNPLDALAIMAAGADAVAICKDGNGAALVSAAAGVKCRFTVHGLPELENDLKTAGHETEAGLTGKLIDMWRADRDGFARMLNRKRSRRETFEGFLDRISSDLYKPYPTGLKFFDDALGGGIIKQSLITFMGAPGVGKTTFCQQLAGAIAEQGNPVLYLNLEMSLDQMLSKDISRRICKDQLNKGGLYMSALQVMRGYEWSEKEKELVKNAVEEYRLNIAPHLEYLTAAGIDATVSAIYSYMTARAEENRTAGKQPPAVIVDYLHLIKGEPGEEAPAVIKDALKRFKDYAMQYNTFVVAISAANRESNKSGRINMYSGRDSSALEYSGDYIIALNYTDAEAEDLTADALTRKIEERRAAGENIPMYLKILKSRMFTTRTIKDLAFVGAGNYFDSNDAFTPAAGTPYAGDMYAKARQLPRL